MKRLFLTVGAAVLGLIPVTSFLVMWEVINISHHTVGWFVVGYLTLVLVLLAREILADLWRWWLARR